ncbi:ester cyclase [Streptomyces yerevanensis]|uniref:ester cyclase n=1 Tax=Streptomyces yerevanensis TaxID=66378 RepID=UPI00099798B4|nr:ester cyclase [Streptomyces yerevanensis]
MGDRPPGDDARDRRVPGSEGTVALAQAENVPDPARPTRLFDPIPLSVTGAEPLRPSALEKHMSSSNVETRTSTADLHQFADELIRQLNLRDTDGAFALFAPDARLYAADGTTTGVEENRAVVASVFDAFPDITFTPVRVVAEDDWLAIGFIWAGTSTRPFNGTPATGRSFKVLEFRMFKVVDGKITEAWGLIDLASLFAQLQS